MATVAARGDRLWKCLVAGGSILVCTFEYGHFYLEKEAELKTKRMLLNLLKKQSMEKDMEIAHIEAAWEAEMAQREAQLAKEAAAKREKEEAVQREKEAAQKRWFS
ncbi:unnamed protein product [Urochloa humidicola]